MNTTELVLTVPELMTARDLNKATRSFSAARLVGRGRNAAVYRATLPSGAVAAAKRLETPPFGSSSTWSASDDAFLRQQVSVPSTLRHDNLVRLLGYAVAPDLLVLVFEFATMGTLHDVLHGTPRPRAQHQHGSIYPAPSYLLIHHSLIDLLLVPSPHRSAHRAEG